MCLMYEGQPVFSASNSRRLSFKCAGKPVKTTLNYCQLPALSRKATMAACQCFYHRIGFNIARDVEEESHFLCYLS